MLSVTFQGPGTVRVAVEPGFIIGHEYVGTVVETGGGVHSVSAGDRVLGCFQVACGTCLFCRRGAYHKCDGSRTFGHGATLGSLPGTQAELALVPYADLALRRVPDGMSSDSRSSPATSWARASTPRSR